MSSHLSRFTSLAILLFSFLITGCTEEALRGVIAGSIVLYVIGAILLFALVIFALVDLLRGAYPTNKKILWLIIILIIPYLGAILYFLIGRERSTSVH